MALTLLTVACGEPSSSRAAQPNHTAESSSDLDAFQAAEATVRAYFAVKSHAADPIGVQIDVQAVYLTSRDVHPNAAYEDGWHGLPIGFTDREVSVELSDMRRVGDEIRVDFAFEHTSVSYPVYGFEPQLDRGQPGEGYWKGTATLVERDGQWLINGFTTASSGGSLG